MSKRRINDQLHEIKLYTSHIDVRELHEFCGRLIEETKDHGYDQLLMSVFFDDRFDETTLSFHGFRPETPEEVKARRDAEKELKKRHAVRERAEYERLKAKYG